MKPKIKKCKVCKKEFEQFNSLISWCSPDCGYILSKDKLKAKKANIWKSEKKILKEKQLQSMTPSKYVSVYVQPVFNEIARLIDKNLPCICRNTFGKMDGGHYRSVANNTTIRLNLHNIHRQGVYSNREKGGDNIMYMDGLINEYGQEYFDFVHYKINQTPSINLSTLEYMEVKKKASAIRNDLKRKDLEYCKESRIKLRNEINKLLDIYSEEFCVFKK